MKIEKILLCALFATAIISLLAPSAKAWQPSGWVYHNGNYAYSIDDGVWHYLQPSGRQWRVNTRTGAWGTLGESDGWNLYRWPYAYSFDNSVWFWFNPGDELWSANMFTGDWSIFGVMPDGMSFARLTDNFIFRCYPQDRNILNDVVNVLDARYAQIESDLQSHLSERIPFEIYPDIDTFHQEIFGESKSKWVVGVSRGGWQLIAIVSPQNTGGFHDYNDVLEIAVHECTHCLIHYKYGQPTIWLNEGFAEYESLWNPSSSAWYRNYVGGQANKLTLQYMEDNWGASGTYQFAFSVADFLVSQFGWSMTRQFMESENYGVLGFGSETEFQAAWHLFIDQNY